MVWKMFSLCLPNMALYYSHSCTCCDSVPLFRRPAESRLLSGDWRHGCGFAVCCFRANSVCTSVILRKSTCIKKNIYIYAHDRWAAKTAQNIILTTFFCGNLWLLMKHTPCPLFPWIKKKVHSSVSHWSRWVPSSCAHFNQKLLQDKHGFKKLLSAQVHSRIPPASCTQVRRSY